MKTKLCKPVLIESNDSVYVGDIMKYVKLMYLRTEYDCKLGSLTININRNVTESNEYWQKYKLVLVSLDPKEIIKEDDFVLLQNGELKRMKESDVIDYLNSNSDATVKVIATQKQLSPEYIKKFIKEYNENNVQNVEVEGNLFRRFGSIILPCSPLNNESNSDMSIYSFVPKTTNNFVAIVEKEKPKVYTEEETFSLMQQYLDEYVWTKGTYMTPQNWLKKYNADKLIKTF